MLNRVMLIGNIGRDLELKTSQSGLPFTRLSVAVNESYTDKNTQQKQERTSWISVVVYDRLAENCARFLTKGSTVFVEGKLIQDSYPDPNTGKNISKTYVRALTVKFLSKPQAQQGQQQYQSQQYQPQPQPQQAVQPRQQQRPQQQQLSTEAGGYEDSVPF